MRGLDIDIVIAMDTTASMEWCLEPAKQLALEVLNKAGRLRAARSVRCGVVAYRDIKSRDEKPGSHVQRLELTDDADAVAAFIGGIKTVGNYDVAEDVAGGLLEAFESEWRVPVPTDNVATRMGSKAGGSVTMRQHSLAAAAAGQVGKARPDTNCRIVLHIWDSPPHGSAYHDRAAADTSAGNWDHYAAAGPAWDPGNEAYLELAKDYARNGIIYVSVRAPPEGWPRMITDTAWAAFRREYMLAIPQVDPMDFPLTDEKTRGSEIVRLMTRATEASIAAFSRSIGGRMAHRKAP